MNPSPPPTYINELMVLLMSALGLQHYAPELFLGGLAMALAGAFAASRVLETGMVQRAKPLSFLGTFSTGLFVSVMAAAAADVWMPEAPLVLIMGASGLVSSFVLPLILKVASRLSSRADAITDRGLDRILPAKGKNKPKD